MPNPKKKPDEYKEIGRDISLAAQKLISEKLGSLQDLSLLGNRLFRTMEPPRDETSFLNDNVLSSIQANIVLEKSDFELGESFQLRIQLQNTGNKPVSIVKIDPLVPTDFEPSAFSGSYEIVSTYMDLKGKKLDAYTAEYVDMTLRPIRKGTYILAPGIIYVDNIGMRMSCKPEPVLIHVSETTLPNRIKTGFEDLDILLFGGIPSNSATILTSISCDERDLLVKRFLEAGAKEGNKIVCAVVDPESVRSLAEDFRGNFNVLVCSTKTDDDLVKLPNVTRAQGVENLTEVNIALETLLENLGKAKQEEGRFCLEILSDVLLEHGAVQTRKWLSRLIPELRSKGFTTLAVVNPQMHTSEQLHAILDLFDGEIVIYEKGDREYTKYLRIRKMHRERYLETELVLKKNRLMTTPLTLSCCRRAFNV